MALRDNLQAVPSLWRGDGDRIVNNDTDGCDGDDNDGDGEGDGEGVGTAMKEARIEKKGGAEKGRGERAVGSGHRTQQGGRREERGGS